MLFWREILFSASLRMKKVGELRWELHSYNTCEHHDRMFNFAPDDQRKLVVSEVFLGEEVRTIRVNTGVDCKCKYRYFSSCCPLGEKILLMAGNWDATDFFCALVSIDPGELTGESIHIEERKVIGWERYKDVPFLVQISENEVWASFYDSNEIWIGELKGDELIMTKHLDHLPIGGGFGVAPLPLPDGRFLAAGGLPPLAAITLITPGEHFSFEKVGDMPGDGRSGVSMILIGERFLVGFGGWNGKKDMDNMWIFDLQTKKASPVKREGEWHSAGPWPVLAARDKDLYVIGSGEISSAHCLSFLALSHLIEHDGAKSAFCSCLGIPLPFNEKLERKTFSHYIPLCL